MHKRRLYLILGIFLVIYLSSFGACDRGGKPRYSSPQRKTTSRAISNHRRSRTQDQYYNRQPNIETKEKRRVSEREEEKETSDFMLKVELHRQQILETILEATGLKTPPDVRGKVLPTNPSIQSMIEEANNQPAVSGLTEPDLPDYQNDEPYDSYMDVARKAIILPVEPDIPFPREMVPPEYDILYFKIDKSQIVSKIKRVLLHLWIKPYFSPLDHKVPIKIKVLQARPKKTNHGFLVLEEHGIPVIKHLHSDKGYWTTIEIYRIFSDWLSNSSSNYGIVVEALSSNHTSVAVTDPKEDATKAPSIEVVLENYEEESSKKKALKKVQCWDGDRESSCCRYPLLVDFVECKWDFIVAPKAYEASFCNGKCPYLSVHKQPQYHTMLQKVKNTTTATVGRCCGVKRYSPIKVLYYDHSFQIKYDVIKSIVVESCGCL